jgi:hypothetical protein
VFQLLDDHSRFIVGSWVDTGETSAGAVACSNLLLPPTGAAAAAD